MGDKKLVVYYINDKGEKEKHDVVIKDGKASFTTNHFSIYTLAEELEEEIKDEIKDNEKEEIKQEETENPNTYDGIYKYIGLLVISLIGLFCINIFFRKKNI